MADGTTKTTEKKKPARQQGPRPAYVLLNLPDGVSVDDVEVVEVTRKAEDALAAIDSNKASNYLRIMIK